MGTPQEKKVKDKVSNWNIFKKATAPSTAASRPVSSINAPPPGSKGIIGKKSKNEKNEIFVDIFEKLSVSIPKDRIANSCLLFFSYRSFSIRMVR